jgi:hypothetical protein
MPNAKGCLRIHRNVNDKACNDSHSLNRFAITVRADKRLEKRRGFTARANVGRRFIDKRRGKVLGKRHDIFLRDCIPLDKNGVDKQW